MFLPYINKSDDDGDGLITWGRICGGFITGGKYMWGAYNWGDVYVGGL